MKKMTTFRIILLCVLIPVFIATAVYFYIYNSPASFTYRKVAEVIKVQDALKQDLEKIVSIDNERYTFEMGQLKKLMGKEEFSLKQIDVKGISNLDEKILGELELFKDKIRICRDMLEAIELEQEKYTEKYEGLLAQLNRSASMLAYFAANYQQALTMDKAVMDNFEKFVLSEGQIYVLKPLERYYRQAKAFKNMFVNNYDSSVIALKNIKTGETAAAAPKPQEGDIKKITDGLLAGGYKTIEQVKSDVTNDAVDDLVLLLNSKGEDTLQVYSFKNGQFEKIWEENLGPVRSDKLFLRHYSIIPEIVVLPEHIVFKCNSGKFEKIFP